ncbi:unnamed protein product, partial [Coccothraustes coccothraustes]
MAATSSHLPPCCVAVAPGLEAEKDPEDSALWAFGTVLILFLLSLGYGAGVTVFK